jgi:two-component system, cell cycle response regulator
MGARSRLDLLGLALFGVAVAGAVALCFSLLVGFGPTVDGLADRWLGPLVPALAGASILARCVGRSRERAAWCLVALALILWATGESWYSVVLWDADPMPFPSVADAFWLAFYPAAVAALLVLVRSRRGGGASRVSWLDGAIGGLGIAAAGAAAVFAPIVDATGGSALAVATNLAYPLGDLLLVALVIGLVCPTAARVDRTWAALALGFVLFGVTDSVYLFQIADATYAVGTILDAGWVLGAAVLASAAWMPAATRSSSARGWGAFVLPGAFGALALGVLVYDHFQPVHLLALALAVACLVAVIGRMTLVFGENLAMLASSREDAVTDSLTGLWNRRKLVADLEQDGHGVLVLLDLDGFKAYNDTYGHLAGDALLDRLGRGLATIGTGAYRMGGDEFCVLAGRDVDANALAAAAAAALHERGEGFEITCSFGVVALPQEAKDASSALRLADRRMYAQKQYRRASAGRQSKDVLIRALGERNASLLDHVADVADLAIDVGRFLGVAEHDLEQLRHVAELHDVGKVAIPDAILQKEGVLDDEEWAFVHQHTLIGERIVGAAPALATVARTVRSTHERWDGLGYPDGLCAEEIPLAARIVAVCDAVSAMVSARPYRDAVDLPEALAELERCAGSQFDPDVVAAACAVLTGASAVAAA